jgi:hypothetical protein
MKDFLSVAGDISTIYWLITLAVSGIIGAFSGYRFARFSFKRERYLYTNLKRPVVVIEPTDQAGGKIGSTELEEVKIMIKDNEFLSIDEGALSYKTFSPRNNHCLVVLGYVEGMAGLEEIMTKVKNLNIPLIVYTYGGHVASKEDKALFDTYAWTNYANYRTSLLNTIFGTLASWPYYINKKK